jgi:ribose 5-phosphate isomerase
MLRTAPKGGGSWETDQGNHILDARFDPTGGVAGLGGPLAAITGVVGPGLFTRYAARSTIVVGHPDRVEVIP